jgi:hypothetical protein
VAVIRRETLIREPEPQTPSLPHSQLSDVHRARRPPASDERSACAPPAPLASGFDSVSAGRSAPNSLRRAQRVSSPGPTRRTRAVCASSISHMPARGDPAALCAETTYPAGVMSPLGRSSDGSGIVWIRFFHSSRHFRIDGPRLRRPCNEKRSGASGTTRKSAVISAARLIAPRFGPASVRMTCDADREAARCNMRQNADVTRKARSCPSRHLGHCADNSSSNDDKARSPGTRSRYGLIRRGFASPISPAPSISGFRLSKIVRGRSCGSRQIASSSSSSRLR